MTDTTQRKALVTGGNRGIGRAIAEGLIAQGLDVTIAGRDPEAGKAVAEEIGARFLKANLDRPHLLGKKLGRFDILVNNAGVLHEAPLFDEEARFAETMRVMAQGPYEMMRLALPGMAERGYGRVVNVSSGWGSFAEGLEGPGAYGIAKAALNALTVAAARAAPEGVKINAMCPGWVRTRMGGDNATRSPEEGADTAIWLATLDEDGPTGGFFRDRAAIGW